MYPQASLYINGDWVAGEDIDMESINPANGKVIWQGRGASDQQVDAAVVAANEAFSHWAAMTFEQRAAQVRRFTDILEQHRELMADTIGQETGKPLWEAETEVAAMIAKTEISIQSYLDRTGHHEQQSNGLRTVLRHRPHGALAVFGPYNFPAHLPNGHIIPALLAGNTVIFKPSEQTPRTAELTVHLWQKADIPDGVINLLQGARSAGQALAAHSGLRGLLFTGSATTGCSLHRQFGGSPEKILALEMGGNNPLIIGQISNVDAAVLMTIQSAYISAGQRCTCARRLFVPRNSKGDQFMQRLSETVLHIETGPYNQDPAPFMGAVISTNVAEQLLQRQHQLVSEGGKVLVAMDQLRPKTGLLSPGLIDVTRIKSLSDEEDFGPLLKVIRYSDFDQAIAQANNTAFGLAAGLISEDSQQHHEFSEQISAGIVNWNRPTTGASSSLPFGGIGISGNHRASAWYAADYCAYPVASIESEQLLLPEQLPPGLNF